MSSRTTSKDLHANLHANVLLRPVWTGPKGRKQEEKQQLHVPVSRWIEPSWRDCIPAETCLLLLLSSSRFLHSHKLARMRNRVMFRPYLLETKVKTEKWESLSPSVGPKDCKRPQTLAERSPRSSVFKYVSSVCSSCLFLQEIQNWNRVSFFPFSSWKSFSSWKLFVNIFFLVCSVGDGQCCDDGLLHLRHRNRTAALDGLDFLHPEKQRGRPQSVYHCSRDICA